MVKELPFAGGKLPRFSCEISTTLSQIAAPTICYKKICISERTAASTGPAKSASIRCDAQRKMRHDDQMCESAASRNDDRVLVLRFQGADSPEEVDDTLQ
jgi:hypothetical protein